MRQLRDTFERMRIMRYVPERTQVIISWVIVVVLFLVVTVLDDNTHGFWHGALWDALWFMTGAGAMLMWQQRRR